MTRVVVDASFCGAWVLEDEHSPEAEALLIEALRPGGPVLCAPTLWTYEMLNLIRSAEKRKRIREEDAAKAVGLISRVPIEFIAIGDAENHQRVFSFARLYELTAYDASYLELAERLQCSLKSGDRKLMDAFARQTRG